MIEVVPTVVPDSLEDVARTGATYAFAPALHIDASDGIFAPTTTWTPGAEERFPKGKRYEVHLMVRDPRAAGLSFIRAGATALFAHVETFPDVAAGLATFAAWREAGAHEIGVAVLLGTPLEKVEPYVRECNQILFMTIGRIGVQGIPFEPAGIARIAEFHQLHPEANIAVDGGVSEKNIEALRRAGARHFSVGSAISRSPDPAATYQQLLSLAEGV